MVLLTCVAEACPEKACLPRAWGHTAARIGVPDIVPRIRPLGKEEARKKLPAAIRSRAPSTPKTFRLSRQQFTTRNLPAGIRLHGFRQVCWRPCSPPGPIATSAAEARPLALPAGHFSGRTPSAARGKLGKRLPAGISGRRVIGGDHQGIAIKRRDAGVIGGGKLVPLGPWALPRMPRRIHRRWDFHASYYQARRRWVFVWKRSDLWGIAARWAAYLPSSASTTSLGRRIRSAAVARAGGTVTSCRWPVFCSNFQRRPSWPAGTGMENQPSLTLAKS